MKRFALFVCLLAFGCGRKPDAIDNMSEFQKKRLYVTLTGRQPPPGPVNEAELRRLTKAANERLEDTNRPTPSDRWR